MKTASHVLRNPPDQVDAFDKQYEIKILNIEKRAIYPPMSIASTYYDGALTYPIRTENLITLTIPQKDLETLIAMNGIFYNNGTYTDLSHTNFAKWAEKTIEEKKLQETNESVRLAYEQYKMLLKMAGDKQ